MRFKRVASFFDRDRCYDAYTGDFLFKAQFAAYDGSQPDGNFQRRRTVSMAYEIILPERGCVTVHGQSWILASPITDGFYGQPVRKTCSAKLATNHFEIHTPGSYLAGDPKPLVMGQVKSLKDTVNAVSDSEYDPQYLVSLALYEKASSGHILKDIDTGDVYFVRSKHEDVEGYTNVTADYLDSAVPQQFGIQGPVDFYSEGQMDPITEMRLPGITGKGLMLDMYRLYSYFTEADPKNKPGDMTMLVENAAALMPGETVTVSNGLDMPAEWVIQDIKPYLDAKLAHLRRK